MRLNITMMRDCLKCPQLAQNLHIQRRGSLHTPVALEVGILFHEAMECRMQSPSFMTVPHELPSWTDVGQKARDTFMKHRLWVPINAFLPDPNWEVHGIELKVQRPIAPNLTLEGTLDGFIIWQNKLWDLQWKTYTDGLQDLLERVRLSWHEVGYQWMAEHIMSGHQLPWGGTILGACQKLPSYRIVDKHREEVTDTQRELAFSLHYITRGSNQQADMVSQLLQTAMQVQDELEHRALLRRNFDSCFSPWGGRCQFFDVCHNGQNLFGPDFKDLGDRYAKGPEESGTGAA